MEFGLASSTRCLRWSRFIVVLHAASILTTTRAQVLNLRFTDEDADASQIGGYVHWEKPAAGDDLVDYTVYLAEDSNGTNQTALPHSPWPPGAYTNDFPIAMDTVLGSFTHLLVYVKPYGGAESDLQYICIQDNPNSIARQMYATTVGWTKATELRNIVVAQCYTSYHTVTIDMVATATWTGSVSETDFDTSSETSGTATYLVSFPTGAMLSAMESEIFAQVTGAPVPTVFTGAESDASYSLGTITAASVLDGFNPHSPDPDIARYIARSCVHFNIAGSVMADRKGRVWIQTMTDKQNAVREMANVYLNTKAVVFTYLGAAVGTLTSIESAANQTQAQCYQITFDGSHQSCTANAIGV